MARELIVGADEICQREGWGLSTLMEKIQLQGYPAKRNKEGVWQVDSIAAANWHKDPQFERTDAPKKRSAEKTEKEA